MDNKSTAFFVGKNMDKEKYSFGGRFKTTIGKTNYEVVVKFRNEGMTMQDRALRAVNESVNAEGKRLIFQGD